MTDEQPPPAEDRPAGLEVARSALAAAKAEARRRGLATPSGVRRGQAGDTAAPSGGTRQRRRTADTSQRSGAHPDERDPQQLAGSLERLLAERGWQTDAAVGGVMGRWAALVGPEVAEHSEPVSFEDGELVVSAASTAWATELRLLAPALVRRLAEELGAGTVTRIVVRGPSSPSWTRGPLRVRGRGPRDTYG